MSRAQYGADAVEVRIADAEAAVRLLTDKDPSFLRYVRQRRHAFEKQFGPDYGDLLDRSQQALLLAYARFAARHGSWSEDLHDYHNEAHALEILADRIDYLCDKAGAETLPPQDWVMLTLFAAMHDLRQRERGRGKGPVGANEQASIDEAHRILGVVGFKPENEADAQVFADLEMMIAGSTFNARPTKDADLSPAEAASSAGALAPSLVQDLDRQIEGWQDDQALRRRVRLTLIASDLDTANVAEPIIKLAKSAVRLCREIEFRAGREVDSPASAQPVLTFLTQGQENYFFELHQFDSELGRQILGPMKERNAPLVRDLCRHLRQCFGPELNKTVTGTAIIDEFMHQASALSGRAAKRSPDRC